MSSEKGILKLALLLPQTLGFTLFSVVTINLIFCFFGQWNSTHWVSYCFSCFALFIFLYHKLWIYSTLHKGWVICHFLMLSNLLIWPQRNVLIVSIFIVITNTKIYIYLYMHAILGGWILGSVISQWKVKECILIECSTSFPKEMLFSHNLLEPWVPPKF